MSQVIIYPNEYGCLSVVIPALACGLSVEEIARKDVPAGIPFHIVDSSDLPGDDTFFNAWSADFTNPMGHGIGQEAWFEEQAAKEQA